MKQGDGMKKHLVLFFISLMMFSNVYAEEKLEDGWYITKSLANDSVNNWAYYKDGKEEIRLSHMVFVHRGWGTMPENSLESFKKTRENGYYGVETDVRFTKDNIPVLSHDATINRIARNNDLTVLSQTLKVKDLTLEELNNYSFVTSSTGTVLEEYRNNKITTFEETLIYAKENKMTLLIELKEGTKDQIKILTDMAKKYDMDNHVVWISFYPELLKYVSELDDDEILHLNYSDTYKDQLDEIFISLKTNNNLVNVQGVTGSYDIVSICPDMPAGIDVHPMSKYILETKPYVEPKKEEKVEQKVEEKEVTTESNDTKVEVPNTNKNISIVYKLIALFVIACGLFCTTKIKIKK